MTEIENVDRVRKIYEAFGRGEVSYILEQLTADVSWVSHYDPIVPWGGDYTGKVPKFFEALNQAVEVTSFAPREFVAQGPTVVSMGDFGCKVRSTGKASLSKWVFIWKFREGKVASFEQFHDPQLANAFR